MRFMGISPADIEANGRGADLGGYAAGDDAPSSAALNARSITFTVPGEPVAKGRARSTKSGRHYTPEKTVRYESTVALFASKAMGGKPLLEGPLHIEITAIFAWPDSWSQKKRCATPWKISRPDCDNLHKAVADAMNGVVYKDDCQIVSWCGVKSYDAFGKMVVKVCEAII